MINQIFTYSFRYIILVLLQVLVLNNILFAGYANPYLYILFILLLPFETPKLLLLFIAFALGFSIDIFSHTIGMHTAACVAMAYFRPLIIKTVYSVKDFEQGIRPIIPDMGFSWVLSYSVSLIFIHHFILFFIEAYTFANFWITISRIIVSTLFTLILVVISHYLMYKHK